MKKIILSILAIVCLSVLAFSYSDSSKRGYGKGYHESYGQKQGSHKKMRRIMSQLDLTSDQKSIIKEIKKTTRESKIALKEEYSETMQAIKSNGSVLSEASKYMSDTNFNKATFIQLATDKSKDKQTAKNKIMEDTRVKRIDIMAENMEKIFNILTQAQRLKFIELADTE